MKKYKCFDCGALNIKPFLNGDNKVRCEECATKFYKNKYPYGAPTLKKNHFNINTNCA